MHSSNIVHRDLKPENILVGENLSCKIADFGISAQVEEGELGFGLLKGSQGTFMFMSPECAKKKSEEGFSGFAADVWSLGVTLYCCWFLKLPFEGASLRDLFEAIDNKKVDFTSKRKISDGLKNVLERMLEKEPGSRIRLEELEEVDWLNKI